MKGCWEWHERARTQDGRFARRDPDGGRQTANMCLRLPTDVIERIRDEATTHKREYGQYVADVLRRYWGVSPALVADSGGG